MWIVFALSGLTWFAIGNATSIAANPGTCQEVNCRSNGAIQLEVKPTGLLLLSSELQPTAGEEGLDAPEAAGASELGILRVRELKVKPPRLDDASELGILRVRKLEVKPPRLDDASELGIMRVRKLEVQSPKLEAQSPRLEPTTHLLARVSYFQTNNVFSGVDPVYGGLISSGLTLSAAPALGPKTDLVTVIDGNLIGYVDRSEFNYNQLRFRASIRQRLTPRMYGEIGWNNQQLFRAEEGDRFLDEHSIRLALYRRDPLNKRFALSTLYEFRLSNANPDSRSRMINSLSVSLSYYIQRNLQVGLDYQFGLSNFTQRQREDQYHRLLGHLTYAVSPDKQISVQGGLSLGSSSDPNIDFDNFFFSVTYTVDLGQF